MTLATILSRSQQGLDAPLVRVEVHAGGGLPAFSIVGLPETVVKESKDRVRAALANCGFELPSGHITVNLAPADLPKEGGRFDLPIAIGILVASAQLPPRPFEDTELYGELSLGGELHAIRGVLPTTLQGMRAGHTLVFPAANLAEAALARHRRILGAAHLHDVCRYARGMATLPTAGEPVEAVAPRDVLDLTDVRGQPRARRALEIAAAGEHSLLADRSTGLGQEHARAAIAGNLAGDVGGGRARDGGRALARSGRLPRRGLAPAAVPQSTPHGIGDGVGRWWRPSAPRRDLARAQRRAVPGRAARVRSRRARGAARAAGIRTHRDLARGAASGVPGAISAGRRDESMSVRAPRRPGGAVPMHAGSDRGVSSTDLRAVAGSNRPARRGAACHHGRDLQ